jgi:hypothetical protein
MRTLNLAIVGAGLSLCVATAAQARPAQIDFGNFNFAGSGQAWGVDQPLGSGTFTFALNFGSGLVTPQFCMSNGGYVSLGADCTTSQGLNGNNIAAFTTTTTPTTWENTYWTSGKVDLVGNPPGDPYSHADEVNAMRFTWVNSSLNLLAQVVVLEQDPSGAGNFWVQLNYGSQFNSEDNSTPPGILATHGFKLGSNTFSALGPFLEATNYDYCFKEGAPASCAASTVPLPAPALLLGSGLLSLLGLARKRLFANAGPALPA